MTDALLDVDDETGAAMTEVLAEAAYDAYCETPHVRACLKRGQKFAEWSALSDDVRSTWLHVASVVAAGFVAAGKLYR